MPEGPPALSLSSLVGRVCSKPEQERSLDPASVGALFVGGWGRETEVGEMGVGGGKGETGLGVGGMQGKGTVQVPLRHEGRVCSTENFLPSGM